MRKLVPFLLVFLVMAVLIVPVQADVLGVVDTIQNHLSLDIINAQYLNGDGNKTALSAAWRLTDFGEIGVRGDLLLTTDYSSDFKWGAGASLVLKGTKVDPKLGIGYLEGPIVYLGLSLLGGGSESDNLNFEEQQKLLETPKLDLQLYAGGGGGLLYHRVF